MSEKIKKVNMLEQYKNDMTIYGAEANIRRMIPAIDGLKLVHRRILYAMFNDLHLDKGKTSKSIGIVGQVLKCYHPKPVGALASDSQMKTLLIAGKC